MRLRKYSGRLIRICVFLLLFVLAYTAADHIFLQKWNCEHLYTFREEEENSLDVLFIGSSHMYKSIMTMEMWNRFGIASYNLGTSEQSLPLSYHLLRMALNEQKPKLVVLDLFMLHLESNYVSPARAHHVFDNMVRSREWYQAVYDIIPEKNRLEYIIPLSSYHSRWTDLNRRDFKPITSRQKGSEYTIGIESFEPYTLIPETQIAEIPEVSQTYLEKIIELCKSEGIALQLVVLPYPIPSEESQCYYNSAACLAAEYDVPFENLLYDIEEIGINFQMDFVDASHLNLMGAYKTTDYLGTMIQERFQIPDRREDHNYANWHNDYHEYITECYQKMSSLSENKQNIIFPFLEQWFSTES